MKKLLLIVFLILLTGCDWSNPEIDITLNPSNDLVGLNSTYIDPGCIISIDGESYDMTTSDTIDTTKQAEQQITYTYSFDDIEYYCYRVVKVMDITPPSMVLNPGVDTVQIGSQHIDKGVIVEDNITSDLTIVTENNVNTTEVGTYTIVYTVTDEANNKTTLTRYVTVYDPESLQ